MMIDDIPGFPGYQATDQGDIVGKRFGRVLRAGIGKYAHVVLYREGRRVNMTVHRLVATTFVSNPENKSEVNHVNGDKYDNRASNLEWATRSENERHAYRTLGKKLTGCATESIPVVAESKHTGDQFRFSSIHEAAETLGLHVNAVWRGVVKSGVYGRDRRCSYCVWRVA